MQVLPPGLQRWKQDDLSAWTSPEIKWAGTNEKMSTEREGEEREHPYETTSTLRSAVPHNPAGCRATWRGGGGDKALCDRQAALSTRDTLRQGYPNPSLPAPPSQRDPGLSLDVSTKGDLQAERCPNWGTRRGQRGEQRGQHAVSGGEHLSASSCLRTGDSLAMRGGSSSAFDYLEESDEINTLKPTLFITAWSSLGLSYVCDMVATGLDIFCSWVEVDAGGPTQSDNRYWHEDAAQTGERGKHQRLTDY